MPAPCNKIEFYRRYAAGEFGNRPRTWESWRELSESGYDGWVTIRNLAVGGTCRYGVPLCQITLQEKAANVRFNESMPDHLLTLQGNVYLPPDGGGLLLEYSREPGLGHREAMRRASTAWRLEAIGLLRAFMDPSSYDDLMELLDTYPEAVIEFSTYSRSVGVIPGRNTVFWEVRNY